MAIRVPSIELTTSHAGEKFKDVIDSAYPSLSSKTFVIGHPRYCDVELKSKPSRLPTTIGISIKDNALNDYMNRSALYGFRVLQDKKFVDYPDSKYSYFNHPEDLLVLQTYEVFVILKILILLKNSDYRLVLRNHPKSKINTWRKLINELDLPVEIDDGLQSFSSWLHTIDVYLAFSSTSIIDCLITNTKFLLLDDLDCRRSSVYSKYEDILGEYSPYLVHHKPSSYDELLNSLQRTASSDGIAFFDSSNLYKQLEFETSFNSLESNKLKFVRRIENQLLQDQLYQDNFYW